ncbi:MAG: aminotransferase class III-fold pyridoxal phosphate-dependent enzyme [Alphaproteobacteria bacterium]|nr:aminotransferase class III-fold pyridoxal phosphate-dependent enzyme [Alphaproteobacteria bacterium]
MSSAAQPNDLDSFFMPFTAQKMFAKKPRMLTGADGMYYFSGDRKLLDTCAGLWCVNAGHNHPKIVEAIQRQAGEMDYAPSFGFSHPLAFQTASRLCAEMPNGIDHVFFSNSGSEAVDTAIKIAIGYQRARGKTSKVKIIGRERAYHGVNIGGISVGGIGPNRKMFGLNIMPHVDHLPHTHDLEHQAFSKGQPEWGGHLADALERMVELHDAENIAAVIVEPVAGSIGVLVPPKGYLEKLRAICDKHDILLIFDEVITAWGRLGRTTAADYFGVTPDIITTAKGINNGAVPMGATFMRNAVFDAFMQGPEYATAFCHGYTYTAHPLACAAAMAAQDVYRDEGLFEKADKMAAHWQDALHQLKDAKHVVDIRTLGLMAGIEILPGDRKPGAEMSRVQEVSERLFWEHDMVCRYNGNTIAMSPPLIVEEEHVAQIVDKLKAVLDALA